MSIVIPVKNIYKTSNDKIIDNFISGVEVSATKITPYSLYEEMVFGDTVDATTEIEPSYGVYSIPTNDDDDPLTAGRHYQDAGDVRIDNLIGNARGEARIEYRLKKIQTSDFNIPKIIDGKYISKLYENSDGKQRLYFDIRVRQKVEKGTCNYIPSTHTFDTSTISITEESENIIKDIYNYSFNRDLRNVEDMSALNLSQFDYTHSMNIRDGVCTFNIYLDAYNPFWSNAIIVNFPKEYKMKQNSLSFIEYDENYEIFNTGMDIGCFDITFFSFFGASLTDFKNSSTPVTAHITRITQEIDQVVINAYGDTKNIETKDVSIEYGNNNNPYSTDGNELLQEDATIDGIPLTQHIANNIISNYNKGKETATILCSISDYYDTSGNKVISTSDVALNKMVFDIYDEVVPTMHIGDGVSIPMSYSNVNLAKTFTVIGNKIYYDGAVWQELTLLETGNYLSPKANGGSLGLRYALLRDEKCYICRGVREHLSVPSNIIIADKFVFDTNLDYLPVKKIDASAFKDLDIQSVTIPNGIVEIGDSSFEGCDNLKSLSLPKTLKTIGEKAFSNCFNITELTLGENLASVGKGAFENLYAISVLNYNITNAPTWKRDMFMGLGINNANSSCIVNIGANVKTIPNSMFESTLVGITKVVFKQGSVCTAISEGAFLDCKFLKSVELPKSLLSIEKYAFYGCAKLQKAELPNSIRSIGEFAFYGCGLYTIKIPYSVVSIGRGAFQKNVRSFFYEGSKRDWLTRVRLGEDWNEGTNSTLYYYSEYPPTDDGDYWRYVDGRIIIWENVYKGLSYELDDGYYSIVGRGSWVGNDLITPLYHNEIPVVKISEQAFKNDSSIYSVSIRDNIQSIGNGAFSSCSNLSTITIPRNISYIGLSAFNSCSNVELIEYNANSAVLETSYFSNTYFNGTGKSNGKLIIGDSVSALKSSIFAGIGVGYVEFGENCKITSLPYAAFNAATNLVSISIPNTVEAVESNAFYLCSSLEKVEFGVDSVCKTIGNDAFYMARNLTTVVLPNSIKSIGKTAFFKDVDDIPYRTYNIFYFGTPTEWAQIDFDDNWTNAEHNIYFYSNSQPTTSGNYWHYVDGEPTIWA